MMKCQRMESSMERENKRTRIFQRKRSNLPRWKRKREERCLRWKTKKREKDEVEERERGWREEKRGKEREEKSSRRREGKMKEAKKKEKKFLEEATPTRFGLASEPSKGRGPKGKTAPTTPQKRRTQVKKSTEYVHSDIAILCNIKHCF